MCVNWASTGLGRPAVKASKLAVCLLAVTLAGDLKGAGFYQNEAGSSKLRYERFAFAGQRGLFELEICWQLVLH